MKAFWNVFWFVLSLSFYTDAWAQPFNALRFDGAGDWVTLPLAGTNFRNGNTDFTIDMWFLNEDANTSPNCTTNFRPLFGLSATGNEFIMGVCVNNLIVSHSLSGVSPLNRTSVATINRSTWYHLIVSKSGTNLRIWLNCNQVFNQTINASNGILFSHFTLGRQNPNNIGRSDADWMGIVDEVHIYDEAVPVATICSQNSCPLVGNVPGLVANWTFNEGIAGGNNTSITQITDASGNGYNGIIDQTFLPPPFGILNSFALNDPTSNFVASTAPLTFPDLQNIDFEIRDYPYRTNPLTSICSGDPAHFCLTLDSITPGPFGNVAVQWEYSDDGGTTWLPENNPTFNGFCFPILPGELTIPCDSLPDGSVNRKYRAVLTVTNTTTGEPCTYISPERDLLICCPISPATVSLAPSGVYCEDRTLSVTATLNSPDPFVQNPGPNVTIDWYYVDPIAGTRTLIGSGSTRVSHTITFPQVPGRTNFCFEVEVTNCNGKKATFSACIPVDPEPVCGTIDACPLGAPLNLMLVDPNPAHLIYEICPGNDAIVCQASPFMDCIPQWQYTFTNGTNWVDLGLSNTVQNTNILPSYLWPAGATSIFYRIECKPLSDPSGCKPCYSNIVEIRLKGRPAAPGQTH